MAWTVDTNPHHFVISAGGSGRPDDLVVEVDGVRDETVTGILFTAAAGKPPTITITYAAPRIDVVTAAPLEVRAT